VIFTLVLQSSTRSGGSQGGRQGLLLRLATCDAHE